MPLGLESAQFSTRAQPGARLGETVTLLGRSLRQPGILQVALRHPALSAPLPPLDPDDIRNGAVVFKMPGDAATCPAGVWMASLQLTRGAGASEHVYTSSGIPIAVLPEVLVPGAGIRLESDGTNRFLRIRHRPQVRDGQRVQVLIGSVVLDDVTTETTDTLQAILSPSARFPDGEVRFVRLRVDGVDSLIFDPARPDLGFDRRYVVRNLP
jgi:hypothetical protein